VLKEMGYPPFRQDFSADRKGDIETQLAYTALVNGASELARLLDEVGIIVL
jgi:hypothetical protein